MKPFRQALEDGDFVLTAELGPPRGSDITMMKKRAEILRSWVNGVNITDNQASVMRLGALAAAHLVIDWGLDPIFQITCRDRNRIALQSDLLSAYVLGVRNVLILSGDYTTMGDHPQAKPVYDLDSVHLLEVVEKLNKGENMMGFKLEGGTELFPGAAVAPEANPVEPQKIKFQKKIKAGAKFFQTQAVMDINKFSSFFAEFKGLNLKIIAGILLIKSAKMARFINKNIPGLRIKDSLIERLERSSNPLETGMTIAAEQINQVKEHCQGVHIMAINTEEYIPRIIEMAKL